LRSVKFLSEPGHVLDEKGCDIYLDEEAAQARASSGPVATDGHRRYAAEASSGTKRTARQASRASAIRRSMRRE